MVKMKKAIGITAFLNLGYFLIEFFFALNIKSISLLADSIDFIQDAFVNFLIIFGLGWSLASRKWLARFLASILMIPIFFIIPNVIRAIKDPTPPAGLQITVVALGALAINFLCSLILVKHRKAEKHLIWAAYLAARNDAIANLAVIAVGLLTFIWPTSIFDIIAGIGIGLLNSISAVRVWRSANSYD